MGIYKHADDVINSRPWKVVIFVQILKNYSRGVDFVHAVKEAYYHTILLRSTADVGRIPRNQLPCLYRR